jgi:antitoxin (DNA-binding transcriptional repressor) of toxin-antitoxin stability system
MGEVVDDVASRGYIRGMRAVGLRELKNRLSEYVRRARSGEVILVRLGGPNAPSLYPEMPRSLRSVTSAELLDAGRGDR